MDGVVTWLLNKRLVVIDLNQEPVKLDPALGIKPKHFPANDKLLNKIISDVKKQYHNDDVPEVDLNEKDSKNRYQAIISWMVTASFGAIPIGNGTRTSLGLNQMVFGGDLHQAPLSFSMHRSRTELRAIMGMPVDALDAKNDALLDGFKKPLTGLRSLIKDVNDFNEMKKVYSEVV